MENRKIESVSFKVTAKDYLQEAYIIDKKIKLDLEKLEAMKASLQGRAASYSSDGSKPSNRRNSTEDSLVRVLDYEKSIDEEIGMLTAKRAEIEENIMKVSDECLREVLTRRYLIYQKWEKIADEMNYGVRHIYKLHNKALSVFQKIIVC